jgi:manganese transport protein
MHDPYSRDAGSVREPPRGIVATLRCLGPGMILAGSVVGSGELIVTTKLGAEAGFTFLWFVLISCGIKVVVQTEIARHTISSGQTFLRVFNELPGPSSARPRWLTLSWMMFVVGASAAGVACYVSLEKSRQDWVAGTAIGFGLVVAAMLGTLCFGRSTRSVRPTRINWFMWLWLASMLLVFVNSGAILGGAGQTLQMAMPEVFGDGGARLWAILIAAGSALLLIGGRYESLEKMLICLVSLFTLVTVVCTLLLQSTSYAISFADLRHGLAFSWPEPLTAAVMLTTLAMYAGTGVAFGEIWSYTYWCLEKGYARHAGSPDADDVDWPRRAGGWVRVMYIDALLTMVVYTASTICFYFLGAAILHAKGLNPSGRETLQVISAIFTETLGSWAAVVFIVGAFCVLLTTVLSGVAGTSRLMADAMAVMGLIDAKDFGQRLRFIRLFVVLSLTLSATAFWLFENPPAMLLITSSLIAALMYPILGIGVLYLRHFKIDPRIAPGTGITIWLWVCGLAFAVISPGGILLVFYLRL